MTLENFVNTIRKERLQMENLKKTSKKTKKPRVFWVFRVFSKILGFLPTLRDTKKSYMAIPCLYFKKSTLNPTSSNIAHFQKFKMSWPL